MTTYSTLAMALLGPILPPMTPHLQDWIHSDIGYSVGLGWSQRPHYKRSIQYCVDRLRSEARISKNPGENAILQSQQFSLGNFNLIKRGIIVR